MTHRWTPDDIAELIQVALRYPRRSEERDRAAFEFAEALTRASPSNPLTESAARYAIDVAAGALEGNTYGASEELLRQVQALGRDRASGSASHRPLSLEARILELAIDACLAFPKLQTDERRAVFENVGLEPPAAKFFEGIDLAIDGVYDGAVRPSPQARRRVEERRRNGTLIRRF